VVAVRFILVAAAVWAVASLVLVAVKWAARPDGECPCGSCALGREVGE
jgi:hypothetical protein